MDGAKIYAENAIREKNQVRFCFLSAGFCLILIRDVNRHLAISDSRLELMQLRLV